MTDPNNPNSLIASVQRLASQVEALGARLEISQEQADRTRFLAKVVGIVAGLAVLGVIASGILLFQVRDAVHVNDRNAITNCENANESRTANKVLWDFLIDASLAQDTQTPESRKLLTELSDYIAKLYQAHDCTDLDRKYNLPSPPAITDLTPNTG